MSGDGVTIPSSYFNNKHNSLLSSIVVEATGGARAGAVKIPLLIINNTIE